jgi:hypothetical protein
MATLILMTLSFSNHFTSQNVPNGIQVSARLAEVSNSMYLYVYWIMSWNLYSAKYLLLVNYCEAPMLFSNPFGDLSVNAKPPFGLPSDFCAS